MKVLVVGGGGREHAIIKSIKKNPDVEVIYALPGNGARLSGCRRLTVAELSSPCPTVRSTHG